MKNASLILSAFVGASIIGLSACTGDSAEQTPPADTTTQSQTPPASEPTVVPNTNVQQTATEVEEADGDDKPVKVEPNKNPVEKASGDVRKGAQEVQKTATDVKETKKEVEKAAEDVKGIFKK